MSEHPGETIKSDDKTLHLVVFFIEKFSQKAGLFTVKV